VWSGTKEAEQAGESFIAIEGRSHIKLDASTPAILPRSWTAASGYVTSCSGFFKSGTAS